MRGNWEKPKPKAKLSLLRSLCLYLQAGGPRQSNEKAYYTGLHSKIIFQKNTQRKWGGEDWSLVHGGGG